MRNLGITLLAVLSLTMLGCGNDVTGPNPTVGSAQASLQTISGENVIVVDLTVNGDKICGFVGGCFSFGERLGWAGTVAKGNVINLDHPGYVGSADVGSPYMGWATLLTDQWTNPGNTLIPIGDNSLRINVPGAETATRIQVRAHH